MSAHYIRGNSHIEEPRQHVLAHADKSKKGKAAESAAARQQQQPSQPAPQSQPAKPQVAAPPAKSSLASPTSPKKAPKSASSPRKVAFQVCSVPRSCPA